MKYWSESESERLSRFKMQGYSDRRIAELLGRTVMSVSNFWRRANGKMAERKPTPVPVHYSPRTCLRCRDPFKSWGPGNRICVPCRDANERVSCSIAV
jgi:hypothetical protein